MPALTRSLGFALWALTCLRPLAYGQRGFFSDQAAWGDSSIQIVAGKVVRVTQPRFTDSDRMAYYDFQVSEWLKPRDAGLPKTVTIAETWGASDTAILRTGADAVLFLEKAGEYYRSLREVYADDPVGERTIRGTRLFLRLMYTADPVQRQQACLNAWQDSLSDPEKYSVLDAMWVTRTPLYFAALLHIALGKDSPRIRAWALCILGYIDGSGGAAQLIPLLSSEPSCDVQNQLLFVFGSHRVQEAVPAIDRFLDSGQAGSCPPWQAETLRDTARQARDKITGKDTSTGWRN